jgi:hypothetical protein
MDIEKETSPKKILKLVENCTKDENRIHNIKESVAQLSILTIPNSSQIKTNFSLLTKKKKRGNFVDIETDHQCKICLCFFSTSQGLGGHMSRQHPQQSEKFNISKKKREARSSRRDILEKAKRNLLKNLCMDYDEILKEKFGKKEMRRILQENKKEYLRILREVKRFHKEVLNI